MLFSNEWFVAHCRSFDLHMNNRVGTELACLSTFMASPSKRVSPDELGVWAHIIVSYIKRHSMFIGWDRKLQTCLRKRMYHEAVELLNSYPPWKDVDDLRVLVARDWAAWINSRILAFEFDYARRLFTPLIGIEEPRLIELKALWISRVRATRVLKHLLTLRKKRATTDAPECVETTAPEQRHRVITDFFGEPTCFMAPVREETKPPEKRSPHPSRQITEFFRRPKCARLD